MARTMALTYPTSDGKPMAETDWHRDLMVALIQGLQAFYADSSLVYVSGNLLIFYVPGDRRKHISPDVFVVKGVPKHSRPNYLIWEEGKGPDLVIELTSSSTRADDVKRKFVLYQDTLKVQEYLLFDPLGDYLKPSLKGFRLQRGVYVAIRPIQGRLPSQVLGLHLERHGSDLRLFDPTSKRWLEKPQEEVATARAALVQEHEARQRAEAEVERLNREISDLRRHSPQGDRPG
jgi:Uma2 family endonuclease